MDTKKAHWPFPDNDQIIRSFSFLMDPPGVNYDCVDGDPGKCDRTAIAILIELENPMHATADGRSRSLAVASPDGRAVVPVTQPIGGLLGYHQPSAATALVFYVSDGAARVLDLEPATRKVRSDVVLSPQG